MGVILVEMNLASALRLPKLGNRCLAFVGAGGKTTAMFQLAGELAPTLATTSTHLGAWQVDSADRHLAWPEGDPLPDIEAWIGSGVTLITGQMDGETDRWMGLSPAQLAKIDALAGYHDLPVLVEADGARQKPLKAPADHEPAIPGFVDLLIVVAGLSALGKPLLQEWVHRPERFSALSGIELGAAISPRALVTVLGHSQGGLKNIPDHARRVLLFTQADTPELQAVGQSLAKQLLPVFHSVLVAARSTPAAGEPLTGSARNPTLEVHAVHESVAGIILAAGGASRMGRPKQLLDIHGEPFVTHVARTALESGLSPVIVVTGAWTEEVSAAVRGLPVRIADNPEWQSGQGSSVSSGVRALPAECGAAIFLLADQPQIPSTLIRELTAEHARTLVPIIAPLVNERRGNPVCFDRVTFPDLLALTGDQGGRALFSRYPVTWLPWHDASVLVDVDTEEDYRKLIA
jgi:molybdenum cofactor cytidylyltransferase